ncbi:beta-1,6-N-acetylglucosaminyltransferase [Limosilactobacillus galli]|uniref:beta-1,6-N-acetylglucosaminyltransferase n=1 Tax=Limosilactobacillus galli TaxID=2991834 RepID=UPI0024BB8587|nr:beta-1,6-N-acetylglucosaminyltransferase [Limosilactobacillus galli]
MQAVLVLAHKNINQVIELSALLRKKFEVYIHFDKKAHLNEDQQDRLVDLGVHWIATQDVHWGAWSIVQATIDLFNLALKDKRITYFHLISGQDWPTKNLDEIYRFFEDNEQLYIWNYPSAEYKKAGEPLVDWQKFYFDYDRINRRSKFGKIYHRLSIVKQTLLHVDKLKKLGIDLTLYNGSQWVDLPRDASAYLIDYLQKHPNVEETFKTGFCSDEFWVPTILRNNTEFAQRIDTNNHRYIDWQTRDGSAPAVLDDRDYDKVRKSDTWFMRKIEFPKSKGLVDRLNIR